MVTPILQQVSNPTRKRRSRHHVSIDHLHDLRPVESQRSVSTTHRLTSSSSTIFGRRINSTRRRLVLTSSDYYFRLDYGIVNSICKPLRLFNTSESLRSIEKMVSGMRSFLGTNPLVFSPLDDREIQWDD